MIKVKKKEGITDGDHSEMVTAVENFYKNLFSSKGQSCQKKMIQNVGSKEFSEINIRELQTAQ